MTTLLTRPAGTAEAVQRKVRPVLAWAVLGVVFFAIQGVAIGGWVLSGDFKSTPVGPVSVPTYMTIAVRVWELAAAVGFFVFLYHFLVKPWRNEGRITLDGLFCLVFVTTVWWQDTIINYIQPWFSYNATFINFGAWNPHILGWTSQRANLLAEPLIGMMPLYLSVLFGLAVAGCRIMTAASRRWPRMGNPGLILIIMGLVLFFDITVEPLLMIMGIYAYPGSMERFTLFHGHYYQYPLVEGPLFALLVAAYTCLRYFRNDKGQTVVERGIERVGVSGRRQTLIRFFALAGACNLIILVVYNIAAASVGLHASPWPQDIVSRPYLTNGICGPSTPYSCPGPKVPMPRPGSAHLGPNGELVRN